MPLIFSQEIDFPTNRVFDWLSFYDADYNKYTGLNLKDDFTFDDKKITISLGGIDKKNSIKVKDKNLNHIDLFPVWFRRPNKVSIPFTGDFKYESTYPKNLFSYAIKQRNTIFWDYLGNKLESNNHLGSFKTISLNKPIVLELAQKFGLTIPSTLITNSKDDLNLFFENNNHRIITKSIEEIIIDHKHYLNDEEYLHFYQITNLLESLDNTPSKFAPSLFQEYIDKKYEIRTVFFNNEFYSASVFTQINEDTKIDMRNRKANHFTRYMPYKLDSEIEAGILKLMNHLELNFGVIDFIKSIDNEYYFLEINPVGQYGDVSLYCNYGIHKKIAEYLIKNESKK
ncbi:grasp-with-spasm system ATP-grasp peptide maturase [uncultured Aquimarina sp.]|uniref:grasp-with-spasm system ATP-grasp peptide maturase n=1 Tax=uncultured Aquimarina sp. TaxID=575652 RepID=UPI0026307575|nr:grasp-with-spasm system ATP-grasp peptide maturase [uncultured Aquimarina sp.]